MYNAVITYRNTVFNEDVTKKHNHAVFHHKFHNVNMREIGSYLSSSMSLPEIEVISVSIVQAM